MLLRSETWDIRGTQPECIWGGGCCVVSSDATQIMSGNMIHGTTTSGFQDGQGGTNSCPAAPHARMAFMHLQFVPLTQSTPGRCLALTPRPCDPCTD